MSPNRGESTNERRRKDSWRQGRDLNSRGIAPSGFRGHRNTGLCDPGYESVQICWVLMFTVTIFHTPFNEDLCNGKLQLMMMYKK